MCKDVLNTSHTTLLKPKNQEHLNLEEYRRPININCSKFTKLFISLSHLRFCLLLHPEIALQPCRSLCVHVYKNCYKYFIANLPWSEHPNCSHFLCHPSLCIFIYCTTSILLFLFQAIFQTITDHAITDAQAIAFQAIFQAITDHAITDAQAITFQAIFQAVTDHAIRDQAIQANYRTRY